LSIDFEGKSMNKRLALAIALTLSTHPINTLADNPAINELREQLKDMKQEYDQRTQALEKRLQEAEDAAKRAKVQAREAEESAYESRLASRPSTTENAFNPNISLILQGRYAHFSNDPEHYSLPGFQLGGEAGLGESGFSLEHSELAISANIDDQFYGNLTAAIHEHDGTTEVELEEAYFETLGLGNGFTIKGGRFFSGVGYLNEQHEHAWDFADAPLIYRGLFGNHLKDDGLQLNWIAPTDLFVKLGAELLRGGQFPAGGSAHDGLGAYSLFAKIGGDIGTSHSWQLGLSHWSADVIARTGGHHGHAHSTHEEHEAEHDHDHDHEHEETVTHTPSFTGDSTINAVDFVYKWAPQGNPRERYFKFQFEYFDREEDGTLTMLDSDPLETTSYDGHQNGWYAQAVYQFIPQWRVGLRYDRVAVDNQALDHEVLAEAGLEAYGHTPQRYSVMLDWSHSEFSRIRLQYNRDESFAESDNQIFLQYTYSLGAHGAHQF
jgi:outer membrane receptor protein involved in Fe transport